MAIPVMATPVKEGNALTADSEVVTNPSSAGDILSGTLTGESITSGEDAASMGLGTGDGGGSDDWAAMAAGIKAHPALPTEKGDIGSDTAPTGNLTSDPTGTNAAMGSATQGTVTEGAPNSDS